VLVVNVKIRVRVGVRIRVRFGVRVLLHGRCAYDIVSGLDRPRERWW